MALRLRSLLCALALCVWALDICVDAVGRCDESESAAAACHVCACTNHSYAPSGAGSSLRVDGPEPSHPAYRRPVYSLLRAESIFQPPKLAA